MYINGNDAAYSFMKKDLTCPAGKRNPIPKPQISLPMYMAIRFGAKAIMDHPKIMKGATKINVFLLPKKSMVFPENKHPINAPKLTSPAVNQNDLLIKFFKLNTVQYTKGLIS